MNKEITLGLIQMDCRLKDLEYNKGKAFRKIEEAAAKGANLVCLPELFTSGYNPDAIGWKWHHFSEDDKGQTLKELCLLARKLKIFIVAPIAEKRELPGVFYNSAIFISDEGIVLGSYAKTHLTHTERNYFRKGDSINIFKTRFGNIGILICYDILFPEIVRQMTLAGAELILLPSAWRAVEEDIWDIILPARALENTVYLAGVNRVGIEEDIQLFGGSCVIDPRGRVLEQGKRMEEDLIIKTINLGDLSRFRFDLPYLRDLNCDLYENLPNRINIHSAKQNADYPIPVLELKA